MENEVRGAQDVPPLPAGSLVLLGFPGSSADKESICNTGEPSSIPEVNLAAFSRVTALTGTSSQLCGLPPR